MNDDDDSISALFDAAAGLTLADDAGNNEEDDGDAASTAHSQKKLRRRSNKRGKPKSQHSLEYMRQRVSHLMSVFEENDWFIPLPESSTTTSGQSNGKNNNSKKTGKVWSNRNYGADKKRQRKQSERQLLDARIAQLEKVLEDEHGVMHMDEYEAKRPAVKSSKCK